MNKKSDRETLLTKAEIYEQTGRYDEMVECMKSLVEGLKTNDVLSKHERTRLSVAFKNAAGARRTAWRTLRNIEKSEMANSRKLKIVKTYREKVADELRNICTALVTLLEERLLPGVEEAENDIFYHKMKGDYLRYLAEIEIDNPEQVDIYIEEANKSYTGAEEYAKTDLAATHPIRLGLALNYSVFLHEMLGQHEPAVDLARLVYDEAMDEIESVKEVDETRYAESNNLMLLLRENIKVWTTN